MDHLVAALFFTVVALGAKVCIDHNRASIGIDVDRFRRTRDHTGCVFTLLAEVRHRETDIFPLNNPDIALAQLEFTDIPERTGQCALPAAGTFFNIHSNLFHRLFPFYQSIKIYP